MKSSDSGTSNRFTGSNERKRSTTSEGYAQMQLNEYTDEELITMLRQGHEEVTDYLMEKYKYLVRKKAKTMFLIGGDSEDLIQEGMIGLFKAVRDFKDDKEASFFSFADLCVSRQIYSAIQASRRQKHIPLNSYISLYASQTEEDGEVPLVDILQSIHDSNPEELVIDKERATMIEYELGRSLSKFEEEVLALHLAGSSYVQIAGILDKSPKSVDNALQRIKSKLNQILEKK